MAESTHLKNINAAPCGTSPRVVAAEDDPPDAGVYQRTRAHGARLLGDVEVAVVEAPVADGILSLRDGQHLGVRGGILERLHEIGSTCDDPPILHHDSADRHLLGLIGLEGLT